MKSVSFKSICAGLAITLGIGCFTMVSAASPQSLPGGDSAGGTTANPKAVMMYNLAHTAYKEGSIASAVIFFQRACDLDPNLADAQYNLAVIFQSQKRYKEAATRFEEVLRIKPSDPDAHYQLGVILMDQLNRPMDARQHLSAIAPNNTHFADAQRRIGALNNTAGQPGQMPGQPQYQAVPQNMQQAAQQASYQANQPAPYTAPEQPAQIAPYQSAAGNAPYGAAQQSPATQPYPAFQAAQPYVPLPPTEAAQQAQPYNTQPSYPSQQTDAQPPQQPYQQSAQPSTHSSAPANAPNPVPVLANTTLRIVATGFAAPSGLTFDRGGYLYVANYRSNSIDRIAPDGTRTLFTSGNNLRGPIGLIADDLGNVYVANYDGGTVAKINPAGVSSIVATGFKNPYYLTLDRDGNLYVSQQADNSIVRITLPRPTAAVSQSQ